ncbi:hypothetical protein [Helcococcus massiliensis]|uniref:hypothetical protein n=1 Tax=Helcococcus massiliensis TaxID=2040290 RepID=UPI00190EBB38|nr:hypothetical protein [Helcococcus massiliensis]
MELVLPQNYVEIEQEEMMYLDGGMSNSDKVLLLGAIAISGAALTAALTTGQFWLGAKIMGMTFGKFVAKLGAAKVAGFIATNTGLSYYSVYKAIDIFRSW